MELTIAMIRQVADWFWRDRRSGRIVIAQWPNLWLWMFAVASIVGVYTAKSGLVGIGAHVIATVALAVWAGDEILRGVNPWRRCLGTAVLVGLATKLLAA